MRESRLILNGQVRFDLGVLDQSLRNNILSGCLVRGKPGGRARLPLNTRLQVELGPVGVDFTSGVLVLQGLEIRV
jgi:hypothetical protein